MKKGLIFLGCVIFCLISALSVYADDISITVDGEALSTDASPVIVDGRTLVPLRAIFEALGAQVSWNGEEKSITADRASTTIYMKIDEKNFTVNGEERALDVPASVIDGRTMVPARAVSESLGCRVEWRSAEKTVAVYSSYENGEEETAEETSKEAVTEASTEAPGYDTVYRSGTYKIGDDIPFGKYVFFSENDKLGRVVMVQPEYMKSDYITKFGYSGGVDDDPNATGQITDDKIIYISGNDVLEIGERGKNNENPYKIKHEKNAYITSNNYIALNELGKNNPQYCTDLRSVFCNEIRLENCYAVPSDEVEKRNTAYNGTYRVGVDIQEGSYGFVKAPGCDFAAVAINFKPPVILNSPYQTELKKDDVIRLINCNITKNSITYIKHESDGFKADINMDISKVSAELKARADEEIKKITPQNSTSRESLEGIKSELKSLAKTDEDKKFAELVSEALDKYIIVKWDNKPYVPYEYYYAKVGNRMEQKEGLNFDNVMYIKSTAAKKGVISAFCSDIAKLSDAKSFNELAEINHKLNDYVIKTSTV